jgi:hypothetical protein
MAKKKYENRKGELSEQFGVIPGLHRPFAVFWIMKATLLWWERDDKSLQILYLCFLLTEYHAMRAYWESRGISPRILDHGTRWRWVVSFTPWPLYPQGNNPWHLLGRRLGGPQSRSGRGGEKKNSQTLPGLEPPIMQPITKRYTIVLSRLLYRYWCSLNIQSGEPHKDKSVTYIINCFKSRSSMLCSRVIFL